MSEHKRSGSVFAAGVYLGLAVLLAFVVVSHERILLPVTLDLPGALPGASDPTRRFEFARVDLGAAALVLLVFSAAMRLGHRIPGSRWIEYGLVAPITTFLVAQVNGITDAGALIALYSLTSAMVLVTTAQLRADHISATSPWGLGTMIGIVPWGIIALHQVGGGLAAHPAPALVQVITMTALLLSAGTSYAFWCEQNGRATIRSYIALSTTTTCLFATEVALIVALR